MKGAVGGHAHFSASTGQFCVKHYAGDVNYTAKNFCDRNKDTMSMDVIAHLQGASHKLVKMFFPPPEAGDEKRRPTTTAFKIKSQAQKLVKTLLECSPHYVRSDCDTLTFSPALSLILFFRTVKSNETKSKKTFDRERVMHQVKYLGLLENIKVRRAGFAFRQEFHTFNERYKYLGKGTLSWKGDDASRCKAILKEVSEALGLTKDQAQIGRSKLFLKQPQTLFQLEKLRSKKFGVFAKVKASVYTLASLLFRFDFFDCAGHPARVSVVERAQSPHQHEAGGGQELLGQEAAACPKHFQAVYWAVRYPALPLLVKLEPTPGIPVSSGTSARG